MSPPRLEHFLQLPAPAQRPIRPHASSRMATTPVEPTPPRSRYFPLGWKIALVLLLVVLAWLLVGIFWRPDWWPAWRGLPWKD